MDYPFVILGLDVSGREGKILPVSSPIAIFLVSEQPIFSRFHTVVLEINRNFAATKVLTPGSDQPLGGST
jgi:hypothetical protein